MPGIGQPVSHYRIIEKISQGGIYWDISPDGKRFLMIKEDEDKEDATPGPRKIVVVLNWFEELKERVPVD